MGVDVQAGESDGGDVRDLTVEVSGESFDEDMRSPGSVKKDEKGGDGGREEGGKWEVRRKEGGSKVSFGVRAK